ncbi:VOC family protein [Spongiivirga sp. MCCC 1A20706]|uniref:VOC family protein n=1 Tax=Spongiivirga sp. MCCC 1A20706 TaxID=3160963 RepID=UPI0039777F9B
MRVSKSTFLLFIMCFTGTLVLKGQDQVTAKVSGMAFVTHDLEGSIEFYTRFLNFKVRKRIKIDTPGGLANFGVTGDKSLDYVGLVPQEFSKDNIIMGINLIEIEEAANTPFQQEGKRPPIAGEQMMAFSVTGLKQIEKMMKDAGIPIVAPLTPSATGKSMTLAVLDPNGIRIQMYEYIKN